MQDASAILLTNPLKVVVNTLEDLLGFARAVLSDKPFFGWSINLGIIAALLTLTQRHDINGYCAGAIGANNWNPVICCRPMKQSYQASFANGASMIEIMQRSIPISFRELNWQCSLTRFISLRAHFHNLFAMLATTIALVIGLNIVKSQPTLCANTFSVLYFTTLPILLCPFFIRWFLFIGSSFLLGFFCTLIVARISSALFRLSVFLIYAPAFRCFPVSFAVLALVIAASPASSKFSRKCQKRHPILALCAEVQKKRQIDHSILTNADSHMVSADGVSTVVSGSYSLADYSIIPQRRTK